MIRYILLTLFTILFSSCQRKQDVTGFWYSTTNEQIKSPFLPHVLNILEDSLIITDGYNFKQIATYNRANDSIYINYEDGSEYAYSFSVLSDSTILFADQQFFRVSKDYTSELKPYKLLDWQSENKFIPQVHGSFIHLIKDGSETKVILNDRITNLSAIRQFLITYDDFSENIPVTYLYLGENIQLVDLLEAYCWLRLGDNLKVELVTKNNSFESFYSTIDYVSISDSIFSNFIESNNISFPHLPYWQRFNEYEKVYLNSCEELAAQEFLDSTAYLFKIYDDIDIQDYLDLIECIKALDLKWERKVIVTKHKHFEK